MARTSLPHDLDQRLQVVWQQLGHLIDWCDSEYGLEAVVLCGSQTVSGDILLGGCRPHDVRVFGRAPSGIP